MDGEGEEGDSIMGIAEGGGEDGHTERDGMGEAGATILTASIKAWVMGHTNPRKRQRRRQRRRRR